MRKRLARADLHLHSKASNLPGGWFSALINCPESYAEPKEIYNRLKQRGMTFVTITDHNTIDGVLEIAHLPDVFISCEYTVSFPEDKSKVHILVYGIDEYTHRELLELRNNVYEFVKYLKEKHIAHSLAHPLYSVQETKITPELVEKFILLFDNWEIVNGTRGDYSQRYEEWIAKTYDGWHKIWHLAEKHKIEPLRIRPNIAFTAGSDDHGGMDVGRTYTACPADTVEEFLNCLREGKTEVYTQPLGEERLLNMTLRVFYMHIRDRIPKEESELKNILDQVFYVSNNPLVELLLSSTFKVDRSLLLKEIIKRLPFMVVHRLVKEPSLTNLGALVAAIGLQTFYGSLVYMRKEEESNMQSISSLMGFTTEQSRRLAYITDTYFEINGVARTARIVRDLSIKHGLPVDVITVHDKPGKEENLIFLKSYLEFPLPYYQELKVRVPSFVDVLDLLKNYSHVHVATPSALGILATISAKILGLKTSTTFHTDIPSYVEKYTESLSAGQRTWTLLTMFMNLFDKVYVPSEKYRSILVQKGVKEEKLRLLYRGVDRGLFSPSKKKQDYWKRKLGIEGKVILYVGRLAKEKNLDLLLHVAKKLSNYNFVLVGDGPYKEQILKTKLSNVHLTGYLVGEELATAYASSYIFVFPSHTDTYGQVVLEALACGLPVVALKGSASSEHIQDYHNGLLAEGPEDLVKKVELLLMNEDLRDTLSRGALEYINSLDLEQTYLSFINSIMEDELYESVGCSSLLS
ncbi:glycosyltransferase [Thermocrinis minervae]|uniref:Glycosyltransferase involved in cell wall bisynthesis n=1 Tax=Thermocrinis minervae TaxID=381751 RepID=A0A1M6T7D6_9AQUI|nr:glycosyltransferase [Thermocrinis minervae]SHK52895.1 Glycosyltransferase involved in cell wall bisynthesis [Thermocrinis minervae]